MKKILQLILLWATALTLNAQTYPVVVSGNVVDANGSNVEGAQLMISTTPQNPDGFVFFKIVNTDAFGNYQEEIEVPNSAPQGTVSVTFLDCGNNTSPQTSSYAIGGNNSFDLDFDFCGAVSGSCNSWIHTSLTGNSHALLHPQASGNGPFTYKWLNANNNFNDLLVTQSGTYCLLVEDADSCISTTCTTVQIGSSNPINSCDVQIGLDSLNTGVYLIALPTGLAPFTFQWSTGEDTQAVPFAPNGANYCVTITDADGCTSSECLYNQNNCTVTITNNPNAGLTATGNGTAPFTYLWDNGLTTPSIQPSAPGNYCVTMTDANGCDAYNCAWWGSMPDSCEVYIVLDSLNTGGSAYYAIPSGTAPFSYQWTPSGNAQSIPIDPAYFGDYCVTVTDADGCVATYCVFGNNNCNLTIVQDDSAGYDVLVVLANPWADTYLWSTGETTQYIVVEDPGTYCVTATGGGCTSTACYYFQTASNFNISGYLYFPDSLNNPGPMQGTVELFFNEPNSNDWTSLGTTNIQSDPAGWSNYYDFGTQNTAGQYIVKATLDPSSPGASLYMPTYHFSTVHWDEADLIVLPSLGSGLFNIILNDGQNFNGGSGNIGGTVTEGDGFTANEEGDRGGDPRPNTSVLLFNSNEQSISHTVTNEVGQYSFANLPFGTYKLMVEIVGVEQVERWVTLTAANPSSIGNDFEVTENGIVLGIQDVVETSTITAFPNPTSGTVNLNFQAKANFDAKFSLSRPDGTTVLVENQQVAKGNQNISLDLSQLPTGLYLLQVTTGSEVVATKIFKN